MLERDVEHDELGDVRELDDHDVARLVAVVAEVTGQPHRQLAHLTEGQPIIAGQDRRLVGMLGERGLIGGDQRSIGPVTGGPIARREVGRDRDDTFHGESTSGISSTGLMTVPACMSWAASSMRSKG